MTTARPIDRRVLACVTLGAIAIAVAIFLFSSRVERDPFVGAADTSTVGSKDRRPAAIADANEIAADLRSDQSADPPNATQRTAVATYLLEVLVTDPTETPVPNALVVLFRKTKVIASEPTAANGVARFEAAEGEVEFALLAPGWAVIRGEFSREIGRRVVKLVEGELIAGRVLVDGAIPQRAVELSFEDADQLEALSAFPREVITRLRGARETVRRSYAATDSNGAFAFHGLSAKCSGRLRFEGPYFLDQPGSDSERRWTRISAPDHDLELRLLSGTSLQFRVVDADGKTSPNAKAKFIIERTAGSGKDNWVGNVRADDEGRIVSHFAPGKMSSFSVVLSDVIGDAEKTYALTPPETPLKLWDLGELALGALREVRVQVVDSEQRPIADAKVQPVPAGKMYIEKTDLEGRVAQSVNVAVEKLFVQAEGFESEYVTIPEERGEFLIVLERACVLEFETPGFAFETRRMLVRLHGSRPLFQQQTKQGFEKSATLRRVGNDADGSSHVEAENKDWRWRFVGLRPGQTFRAELNQGNGGELLAVDIAPLSAGEHRVVPLQLAGLLHRLRVRVLDLDLKPVEQVILRAFDPNESSYGSMEMPRHGEAEVMWFHGNRCMLIVDADGFAEKAIYLNPIPTQTLEVVLDRPRNVEVELKMANGSAVPTETRVRARCEIGNEVLKAVAIGRARFRLENLPVGEVMIEVSDAVVSGDVSRINSGIDSMFLHDTANPFVQFVIHESKTIGVKWQATEAQRDLLWSVAVSLPSDPRDFMRTSSTQFDSDNNLWDVFSVSSPGSYDVWLETRSPGLDGSWERFGKPTPVTVGPEDSSERLVLKP